MFIILKQKFLEALTVQGDSYRQKFSFPWHPKFEINNEDVLYNNDYINEIVALLNKIEKLCTKAVNIFSLLTFTILFIFNNCINIFILAI